MTAPAVFRATLEDGRVIEGPIRGFGGMLSVAEAMERLHAAIRRAEHGRPPALPEWVSGHVGMFPDHCAWSDGARVDVPLLGTEWEILPPPA